MQKSESFQKKKSIAVVGGGPAGLSCALALADVGFHVFLLEKEKKLGGKILNYCCKATDKCGKCGVCLAVDNSLKVTSHPRIEVKTSVSLLSVSGKLKNFELRVKTGKSEDILEVTAFVLATGFSPFDANLKRELGYGKYRNVITGYELEQSIRLKGGVKRPSDSKAPEKIAFIQCVGSRDENIGRGFCSKVCCPYALRLAKLIKTENPNTDITIFYMDIQPTGKNFLSLRKDCENSGIRFVRGLPSKIYGYENATNLCLRRLNTDSGEMIEEVFDLVVLSVGISPTDEAGSLAKLFGVERDKFGFYKAKKDTVSSLAEGVFLAGTCQGPKDISDSITHAKATALQVAQFLER